MTNFWAKLIAILFYLGTTHSLIDPKHADNDIIPNKLSVPIDISSLFNNRAFAARPDDANMDGIGGQFIFSIEINLQAIDWRQVDTLLSFSPTQR